MLKRKIICILLAIILIVSYSIVSLAADTNQMQNETTQTNEVNNILTTEEMDELNQQKEELDSKLEEASHKLEYVQGEMSTSLLEIQKLSDRISQYENENKQLEEQLKTLETSIEENTKLLETVTEEYNQKDQLLRERLVVLYEEGEYSFLDTLLSSESFTQMLSRYYYMQEIAEYDNQLIEKVAEQKNIMDITKRKLENETAQVRILKAKAEQNEMVVKNTRTMHEDYIAQLSEKEQELNDKINEYKVEYIRVQLKLEEIATNIDDFQIQYTGGSMLWPVATTGTTITSNYGTRVYPIAGTNVVTDFHLGLDIAAPAGSLIVSALDGVVVYAGWLGSYGNCVMVQHGNNITTVYGHGQKILTERGKEVKQGEPIMEVGSTGNSTGPHCHFEVRIDGKTTDPLQFVKQPSN